MKSEIVKVETSEDLPFLMATALIVQLPFISIGVEYKMLEEEGCVPSIV